MALPGPGTVGGPSGDPLDPEAFYSFQSFTDPREVRTLALATGATATWYRTKVPVDPSPYVVEQVFYPSKDGTKVSMFLVHRRDWKPDGSAPVLLEGYGGFQVAMQPLFRGSLFPWLERGGVYAMPNLRGGNEYGEQWHVDGMLAKKQNVFDDFIAAAEWLVAKGYARPERIAIRGGSNGGLLVGAAMIQRPDLFGAVLCGVPLLDMVRYHLHGSGKTWIAEYGSSDDKALFPAILAYSPYHHVKKGTRYPATLLLSADSDDRVDPLHARKFAAALQWATTGGAGAPPGGAERRTRRRRPRPAVRGGVRGRVGVRAVGDGDGSEVVGSMTARTSETGWPGTAAGVFRTVASSGASRRSRPCRRRRSSGPTGSGPSRRGRRRTSGRSPSARRRSFPPRGSPARSRIAACCPPRSGILREGAGRTCGGVNRMTAPRPLTSPRRARPGTRAPSPPAAAGCAPPGAAVPSSPSRTGPRPCPPRPGPSARPRARPRRA